MTPLVMIPGMMCDERIFAPQIEALLAEVSVHIADISKHDNISDLAADVLSHAPPKFSLAGHSMGGIVAMEICSQAPERVEKLVLIDTNPKSELEEVKAKREPQISDALSGKLINVIRDEMKPKYLADSDNPDVILNICMDMALSLGPKVLLTSQEPSKEELIKRRSLTHLIFPC